MIDVTEERRTARCDNPSESLAAMKYPGSFVAGDEVVPVTSAEVRGPVHLYLEEHITLFP